MTIVFLIDKNSIRQERLGAFEIEDFYKIESIASKNNLQYLQILYPFGDTIFNYHQINRIIKEINSLNENEKKDLNFFIQILRNIPNDFKKYNYLWVNGD